jgi:hypothetical protein
VFKCEIIRDGMANSEVIYFTNRIEIGTQQQKHSLNLLNEYLWESDSLEARLNLEGIKAHGITKELIDRDAFDVTVELTEID